MQSDSNWQEIGPDLLDRKRADRGFRWPWLPRRRPALGIRSSAAPPLAFILCGVLLGPHALNVLSPAALIRLDVVVSVALAILGVFVGLGTTSIPRSSVRDAIVGGAISSAVTIAIVAGGLGVLLTNWGIPLTTHAFAYAALIGICASASAAAHHVGDDQVAVRAAYLADIDDVPLVLLGSAAIALLAGDGSATAWLRLVLTVAGGAAIGVAGWLLFERASGSAERGVFVAGAVLLLAGIGSYLGTSPLLSGGIAAFVWVRAPGAADRITADDLGMLQHPLVSLLLIVAGALIELNTVVLWVGSALVVLRLLSKLVASFAVAPVLQIRPGVLASALLPPGVMGVALALNVRQVLGGEMSGVVGVVTAAAVASEVVAVFLPRAAGESS